MTETSLKAAVYLFLNSLFGGGTRSDEGSTSRVTKIYSENTVPLMEKFSEHFQSSSRVLIVGCGSGVELEWTAKRVELAVGVDVRLNAVAATHERVAELPNAVCVHVSEKDLPFCTQCFDVVFMHDVCEHLIYVDHCFAEYHRVLKPNGVLINSFGPLFYSPFGAHLFDALKVPWGHLFFDVGTLVEVRNKYYPGESRAKTWKEMGLNQLTESRYRQVVDKNGFRTEIHMVDSVRDLPIVTRIPFVRNFFIKSITSVLRK